MQELVVLDQAAADGWASLGTFTFAAGGDQWLRLDDNAGEANDAMIQLVFDAARLTPTDDDGDDVGAEEEGGTGGEGTGTDGGSGQAGGDAPEGGCGCASSGAPGSAWMLLLVAMGVRRRRQRAGSTGCSLPPR